MEPSTLLLVATGIVAFVAAGPRLIQIRNLANIARKQFEDGHERAATRERNWYSPSADKASSNPSRLSI